MLIFMLMFMLLFLLLFPISTQGIRESVHGSELHGVYSLEPCTLPSQTHNGS